MIQAVQYARFPVLIILVISSITVVTPTVLLSNGRVTAVSSALLEGAAITTVTEWLYSLINTAIVDPEHTIKDPIIIKNSIAALVQASVDPFFEHNLIKSMLPLSDPRRYILLGLFQSGRLAPKAIDYVTNLVTSLKNWWYGKSPSSISSLPTFSQDNLADWMLPKNPEESCPAPEPYEPSLWDVIIESASVLKSVALSCIINSLLYLVVTTLGERITGSESPSLLKTMGLNILASQASTWGAYYVTSWLENALRDIFYLESLPSFTGTPLYKTVATNTTPTLSTQLLSPSQKTN